MNKLSFSINGWKDYSWQDFVTLAEENGFCGIELHNVIGSSLYEKDGPFHKYNSAATVRSLNDKGISVPCVDISVDVSDSNIAENREHIRKYIEFASSIRSPYVRVYASGESENARENVLGCLSEITEFAAEKNVTVLIETTGMFRNTAALRDILIEFACDSVAALWDMYHTFCEEGEDPGGIPLSTQARPGTPSAPPGESHHFQKRTIENGRSFCILPQFHTIY